LVENGALADSAVHVAVQLVVRGEHDHITPLVIELERLQVDQLRKASGRVHEADGFGPLVLENVVMLMFKPARHERAQVEKELEWNSEHLLDVSLESLRKNDLVLLLGAGCGLVSQQSLCVVREFLELVE